MSTASSSSKPSTGWQPPSLEEMQAMLPQYQFECLLGRGGMGAVYKALQITLDRPVAIKVLPGDLIEDSDSQFAERFKNEARTMGKMNHPAIVNVYDFGETNTGLLYIVMEFIDGTDVSKMIAVQGKLPEDYALSITAHVCDALAYAHSHGVIHRDIKPANILINMDGAVKVADFGLAKANDPSQSGITKTNMAMGTPDFVAPEAFVPGVPLDGRADLYAIGVMLYQMLTGEIPRGIWTLPGKKLGTDPRFDSIITKAMQTDREARYQSAADLRRDLDTILTLPRSALVARQQAAAEAAAKATRAQAPQEAASGPQRSPVHAPPPVKKKSSLGPVVGILSSVVLIAGLAYMLKKPAADETVHEASPEVAEAPLRPASPSNTTPSLPQEPLTNSPPVTPAATAPAANSAIPPGWTDLLADVDIRRDVVNGRWEMLPEGLALEKAHGVMALEFNHDAPEEYDFEIEFTVTKGLSDVSQLLSVAGRTLRWKMAQGFGEFYSFGPTLDGKRPDDPARTEAVVKRAHLKTGQRYRSTVEVRKGSLRALLDGEEVLRWSGDLQRMSDENSSTARDGKHLGLACYATAVTFHKAMVRPVTGGGPVAASGTTPAPSAPAMPAAVPAKSSPASVAPAATGTTNIAGPPKLQTMLPGTLDSMVVACSADGTRLIVADTLVNGAIHLSKDSGATWTTASATGRWITVASSADGTKLVAAIEAGSIYTSADSGATWTERPSGARKWSSLACSADGTRIVAVELETSPTGSLPIHISNDSGATWTARDAGGAWWSGVSSSADGTRLVAVGNGWAEGSYIFVSRDSGATWTKRMTDRPRRWSSVASSADGTRLVAVDAGFGAGGQIYTSADSGETWTPREANRVWSAVTCSTDGQKLAATVGSMLDPQVSGAHIDAIYISTDSGDTWQPRELPRDWRSVASSAGGDFLVAAAIAENRSGQVFTLDSRTHASRAGNDSHIAQLEKGFKGRLETDAEQPFRAALAALNKSYITNGIGKARAAAQSRGKLDEVLALDEVKARIERGEGVPDKDEPGTPESLKTLRTIYRNALAKITAERDARAAPLYDVYVKALDAYIAELTKSSKLDAVQKVQELRDDIAAQKPRIAATPSGTTKPVATAQVAPAAPAKSSSTGSSWRTAADYLVNNGGFFTALKNGVTVPVTKSAEIPSGRFDIIELTFERLGSVLPPAKDADFAALNGLRDLQRAHFRPMHNGLSDAAFAFLANNSELINLNIEGANALTDEVLAHIAGLKKLDFFAIQYAENFTGRGLDKIAGAASITNLETLGCGITDEGMRAISTFKKLQAFRTTSPKITAAGFAALTSLKTLVTLTLSGTALDDEGASAIAGIPNLSNLDVQTTKLTDAGLQKLRSLKKLTSLNVTGTAVTLEAAAEFQKVMPQCRVSR